MAVFAVCASLVTLDLSGTSCHGEFHTLEKCFMLENLDLGDTKVFGNLAAAQALTKLSELCLRWTKVSGDVISLEGLPLKKVDLVGTMVGPVHYNAEFLLERG